MEPLSSPSATEWVAWLIHFSIPAVLLVGIALFLLGASTGNYNLKCILAPAIGLSGLLVVWLEVELEEKYPKAFLLHNVFWGTFILILLAALLCSLLGLLEYRKEHRHSSRHKGGKYAVITGLLCLFGFILFLFSLYTKKTYGTRNPIRALTQEKRIRIIEQGFQIYQPESWVQVDGSQLTPTPCVAFTKLNPSLSFSLVVKKPGPDSPTRIEDLIKLAQSQLQKASTSVSFSEPNITDQSSSAIAASAQFESLVSRGSFTYFYVHRLILYKGFAYQLITWGPSNDPSSVRAASELMGSKFSVLSL